MSHTTMSIRTQQLLGAALLALCAPLARSAAPDAGAVLRQLEAQPSGRLLAPRLQTPQEPSPPAADHSGPVVRVNAFRLDGLSLLSEKTVQDALRGFTGRELNFTQLQEAAWVVVQTARDAGWLLSAFVPQQEIEGGVITLRVVEARLGDVRISGADAPEMGKLLAHIQAMARDHVRSGDAINLRQIDRLLLLIDDLPGVTASASFAEGRRAGSTDMLIQLGPDKAMDTSIVFDNHGAIFIGANRLTTSVSLNNPAGLGDALQLQALVSDGSRYGRVAWSLPVGLQGARAGVHASDMQYHLVGSFADLQAQGTAQTWGIDLSAPLVRQPERNLSWQLSTDRKRLINRALANAQTSETTPVSQYHIDLLRTGLSGNWFDQLLSPAQNTSSVQASWGNVHLGESPNASADASAANTAGAFYKLNANYNREQSLSTSLTWYVQASAQWANRNLDSSEKLYLGGASGVRAYPANEAGGSTGSIATTGLRLRLDQGLSLNSFLDWGRIHVYRHNLSATGTELANPNVQSLQGYGLSLNWRLPQGHELAATWSRRQGSNPAANTTTGADSDGTRTLHRLWLSAALNF